MKQKTAIRQLIDRLEYYKKGACIDSDVEDLDYAIECAKELEPVNEQQIKDAYNAYYDQGVFLQGEYLKGEQYFNETFEKP